MDSNFVLNGGMISSCIVLMLPFIVIIATIEFSVRLLKRHSPGFMRYAVIVFSLFLSGFLLIDTFYSAFSVLLQFNYLNDWVQLVNLLGLSEGERMVFVFVMIILTSGYLNLSAKRIIKYINIQ